jgi:3-hydroxyisobutyrate dehydrogenase-like beta-hydroxyacid dehydrogenase
MTATSKELIGVVGVGRMGLAIVKHLIRHGYAAIGQDINEKALQEARAAGATTAATPAEIGKAARVVVVAVGYDHEATAVMLEKNGLLETMADGSVIILCSTCTPDHVRMLADKAAASGVDLLDAPICRGAQAADAGTMLALCGGKDAVFIRAEPVLRTFCSDVALLGGVGAGQFGKALNNYLLWVNGVALIEAAKLSEANGMDLVKLREALLLSSGASDALKNWDNVSFTWALKDMQIVTAMADKANLTLPVAGMIKELVKDGRRVRLTNPPDWIGSKRKAAAGE